MDAVLLARIQFGLVAGFHFLFPPTTFGLSLVILILESLYLKNGEEVYKNISSFLIKILAVVFVMGVATGIVPEFAAHDSKRRGFWEFFFSVGSFLPALPFGLALGNVVVGVPLDAQMEYTGNFFTLLRPLPLVFGLLGLAAFLVHGSTFAALKTEGELQARSRKTAQTLSRPYLILFWLSFLMVLIYMPYALKRPVAWIFAVLTVVCWALMRSAVSAGKDGKAFFFSAAGFLSLWGIVGAIHYPNLVKAGSGESLSITLQNSSSSQLTLTVMLVIARIGMPLVIGYTIYSYKVFRGKVRLEDAGY